MERKNNQLGSKNPYWKGGKTRFVCVQCGNEFFDYLRKRQKRKFCSTECSYESKRRRTTVKCEWCKKTFIVMIRAIEKGHGRFCSRICAGLSRRRQHNVKWRRSTFERDSFTCVRCLKTGVYLNAHHIIPISVCPEERLELDNGATLCSRCHQWVHEKELGANFHWNTSFMNGM